MDAAATKTWSASDVSSPLFSGYVEIDIRTSAVPRRGEGKEDAAVYFVIVTADRVVVGGQTNSTFLEAGYYERPAGESVDRSLAECLEELRVANTDGPAYTSGLFKYNQRLIPACQRRV